MRWQLWAYQPLSSSPDVPTVLPVPASWDASMPVSDVGALNLTYPLGQPGIDVLYGYCDIEVRYLDGTSWVCPPNGRFSLSTISPDVLGEQQMPARKFACQTYSWLLRGIIQSRTTGLDNSGQRVFAGKSIAQAIGILIGEGKAKGAAPGLSWQVVSDSGAACSPISPGQDVYSLLSAGAQQGTLDWQMVPDGTGQCRRLAMYSKLGVDRSTGAAAVQLFPGRDVVSAPATVSGLDLTAAALVQGDDGKYLWLTNPGADLPYGLLQKAVSASGATTLSQLQVTGQAALDKGRTWRAQATRELRFEDAPFLPFRHYGLGDKILAPGPLTADPQAQRVAQISITQDGDRLSGSVILGERFVTGPEWYHKRLSQVAGNGWNYNWNPTPPTPYVPPPPPGGFYNGWAPEWPRIGDVVMSTWPIVPTRGVHDGMPRPCTTTMAALGGSVYALDTRGDAVGNPLFRYSPADGSWSAVAGIAGTPHGHGQVLVSDGAKLYACGGVSGSAYQPAAQKYDPETDAWSGPVGAGSWDAADSTAWGYAGVIGGKVFYGGGEH